METSLTKKQIGDITGGLFLMTLFTAIWVIIAEIALMGRDQGLAGVVFAVIIVYFVICYNKLNKIGKSLPNDGAIVDSAAEKAKDKRFYIIMAVEGVAIFVIKNVLVNTGHDNLFFSFFALIVGLHFFPLARLFNRKFYYVLGVWICLLAIAGFVLTNMAIPDYQVTTMIGIGCALATTANGIRIVRYSGLEIKVM